jgi:hypothetical protein
MTQQQTGPREIDSTVSIIYKIPADIWRLILELLLPAVPVTWIYTTAVDGREPESWREEHQWKRWSSERNGGLASLYRASKTLASIVSPYLYRSVVIISREALASFYEALLGNPDIGDHVRGLYCLVSLDDCTCLDWQREQTGIKPHGTSNSQTGERNQWSVSDMFKGILARLPNVAQMHYTASHDYTQLGQLWLLGAAISEETPLSTSPLNRLKSLHLTGNFTSDTVGHCGFLGELTCDILQHIPSLPALETLEMCGDMDATWYSDERSAALYAPMPQLKHVRLWASSIREPDLVKLCMACPNLQTLLVHFELRSRSLHLRRLPPGMTLNRALGGLAGRLHSLELLGSFNGSYFMRHGGDSESRSRKLTCLPDLINLRHLCIDYRGLFGRITFIGVDDVVNAMRCLPSSLHSLEIVCSWGWFYAADLETETDEEMLIIRSLMEHHALLLPNLRTITIAIRRFVLTDDKDIRSPLVRQAQEYFSTTDIEFKTSGLPERLHYRAAAISETESDEAWWEARIEDNNRRGRLAAAGFLPPLYLSQAEDHHT